MDKVRNIKLYYRTFIKDGVAEVKFSDEENNLRGVDEESTAGEIEFKMERGRLYYKGKWMIYGELEDHWFVVGKAKDYD